LYPLGHDEVEKKRRFVRIRPKRKEKKLGAIGYEKEKRVPRLGKKPRFQRGEKARRPLRYVANDDIENQIEEPTRLV